MLRWFIRSSLSSRVVVVALGAVLMVVGITQLRDMPVDVLPEFGPTRVEVQTEALGLSAVEVEQLITVPMEQELFNGLPFLDTIRSESVPGLSSIELIFERGTDLSNARQLVGERLTQAHALPNVSTPPQMLQPLSSTSRVMMIGLSSKNVSLVDMSVLARWTIGPRLMGVPGVANVAIWGQRDRQLQVQVDPATLQARNVSLDEIIRTTGNALWVSPLSFLEASTPGTGGFVDTPNQRLGIRHVSPIREATDLAQVSVARDPAAQSAEAPPPPTPRLGDVATVVEDHQPLIGDAVFTNGSGLLLVVEKFPDANTLDVTRGVNEALDTLRPGLRGVEVDSSIFRPATYIETSKSNLTTALLIGLVLLVLMLGAFLFDWRSALISVLAISLSVVTAGLVLHLTGSTMNAMVFAGLALAVAVLIDDAVIDVENVSRRLRERRKNGRDESTARIILDASLEVRRPVVYGTLIIGLSLLPVVVLKGESGAFLPPLALAYGAAVLASMVVALVVTPALALLLLSKAPVHRREPPLARLLQRGYGRALSRTIRAPRSVFLATGVIVLLGLALLPFLDRGQSVVPSFRDTDLLIEMDGAPGTSLTEMNRIVARASQELQALPGVRNVGGHVGRAVMADQVVGANASELWVRVDPSTDYDATVASIRRVISGYPGLDASVLTYQKKRIRDVLVDTERDLTMRVYGQDLGVLRLKAEELKQMLSKVDGVADPQVELQAEEPTLEVEVDLARAELLGLKPGDVRRAAATLLSGLVVGHLFEEQKVFDVVVWGAPGVRQSATDVRELLIETPDGRRVRVGDVAEVRVAPSPNVIRHEAVSRSIDVGADVRGRDRSAVLRDVEDRLADVEFPFEHHAELVGDTGDQSDRRLFIGVVVAAAIGIFLLLQAAFESWRLAALIVFLTVPAALVGGVLAAFVDGDLVSIGSIAGFLAVFAIAVRSEIVLVGHYRRLEQHEGKAFGPALVRRGARERLGPTVMTAATTGLAFLPLVFFGDIPGHEIVHPMAVVILGGLVTSTLVTLFAVPALYLRFAPRPQPDRPPLRSLLETELPAGDGHGELESAESTRDASPEDVGTGDR